MNQTPNLLKETLYIYIYIYSKRKMTVIGVSEEELQRDGGRFMIFLKENPHPDFVSNDLLLKNNL